MALQKPFSGRVDSWLVDIPTYGAVAYSWGYPGVDIFYRGHDKGLDYYLLVAPGADPNNLRFSFEGISEVQLDGGRLLLNIPAD